MLMVKMMESAENQCELCCCTSAKEGPTLELLEQVTGTNCRSVMELSLMFAISRTLENSFDLADIVRPVLRRMQDLMGMVRGTITVINRDTGGFFMTEAVGLPKGILPEKYLDLIQPHLGRAVEKKDSVIVSDFRQWIKSNIANTDQQRQWLEKLHFTKNSGLICVPLKLDEEVVGTLSVERMRDSEIGWEADLRFLGMIGSIIARAARIRQETAEQIQSLRNENIRLQDEIAHGFRPQNMIGSATSMKSVYLHIEQVATSNTTVLIRGESGTGKELVAKALHEKSSRVKKPFVKFNCAALPDSIIESELFGHEKGAFTGALSMRKGRFELAHGGTIFLDEIGDVTPTTQVKLLRVLQEKEFERVGGHETLKSDVRVIAATSRNIEEMMNSGTFREDLYYRLNVFPIYVPPLRERKCDILLLADHFIEKYASRQGEMPVRISSAAIDLLMSYHWPGNVRELENCIERSVILAKGQSIKAHHLPPTLQKKSAEEAASEPATLEAAMESFEREMIVDALKETGSNIAKAARKLGLSERKMGLRVKKYHLDLRRFE